MIAWLSLICEGDRWNSAVKDIIISSFQIHSYVTFLIILTYNCNTVTFETELASLISVLYDEVTKKCGTLQRE
jgi:hypothetical protein